MAAASGEKSAEWKVVVLGSQGVGKTSLVIRYVKGTFAKAVTSTIGASFFTQKMMVDNQHVKLQIWDTAGQERFRSMAPMYYRGASAAMLVYDVTSPPSFEDMKSWVKELQMNAEPDIVMCLVANKSDIRDGASVSADRGRVYAESIGAHFFETSALSNTGISDAFLRVTKDLLRHQPPPSGSGHPSSTKSIKPQTHDSPPKQESKCCGS